MDGPSKYYAEWNKTEKDKHDFTYMWDIKEEINKQQQQKTQTQTNQRAFWWLLDGRGGGGMGEKEKRKYELDSET